MMAVMLVWEAVTVLAIVPLPHRLPTSRHLGVTYGAPHRGTRALWMVYCWQWQQASWRWCPTLAPPLGMHKQSLQGTLLARPTPHPCPATSQLTNSRSRFPTAALCAAALRYCKPCLDCMARLHKPLAERLLPRSRWCKLQWMPLGPATALMLPLAAPSPHYLRCE